MPRLLPVPPGMVKRRLAWLLHGGLSRVSVDLDDADFAFEHVDHEVGPLALQMAGHIKNVSGLPERPPVSKRGSIGPLTVMAAQAAIHASFSKLSWQ